MKRVFLYAASLAMIFSLAACGNQNNKKASKDATATAETKAGPEYKLMDKPQVDLSEFPVDKDGYYVIFDGKTMKGWRGYGKDNVPSRWVVDNGAIKFVGSGGGEAQAGDGGDLIFAHKFKNFEFEFEWKVSKGGNSGVLYLAQEVTTEKDGQTIVEPIYISSPEYQVLDNENHPDAKLGVNGNRKSASLYDMIPANPQNAKPYGEWNKGKITISGHSSGQTCSRQVNSARRNGLSHSSSSITAAARTMKDTSDSRITEMMYGSVTSV